MTMGDRLTITALDPKYPALREFSAGRRDLMTVWFMARSATPCDGWIMPHKWWIEGESFGSEVTAGLGETMREEILSGEIETMIAIHVNPTVPADVEVPRLRLLFRVLADFLLYSGGGEVQAG